MSPNSLMRREVLDIPSAVDNLLSRGATDMREAARAIADRDPAFMITVARGSSDHVATYLKYASELLVGIPVASAGPSIASVYKQPLRLANSVCISVSQSGKSPDIVEMARRAGTNGALTIALTNHLDSDLAGVSDYALDLHAAV